MGSSIKSFIKLALESDSLESTLEVIKSGSFIATDEETVWDEPKDLIYRGISSVDYSNDKVLICLEIYDSELLPNFPSEKEIQAELEDNKKRNEEIKKQHEKSLGKVGAGISTLLMGFPENERKCRKELRKFRLVESVEVLFGEILSIKGIIEGSALIRNSEIGKKEEIRAFGSGEDGVYQCSISDMSGELDLG